MSHAAAFRALHHGRVPDDPLVLPGPWDAASARVCVEAGFPALATPSAGVAASLGYEDGQTPADEMFAAVARIVRAVDVPVSADVEDGYGLAPKELVERLLEVGVVGCNLEDSTDGGLKDPAEHAEWLAGVREEAGDRLFLTPGSTRSSGASTIRERRSSGPPPTSPRAPTACIPSPPRPPCCRCCGPGSRGR